MPQLRLIKEANTSAKKVGDIGGIYEDAHKFSDYEHEHFYIEYVAGFKNALELKRALQQNHYEIKRAYRMPEGNRWSFEMPEEKEFWREPGGKWLKYAVSTKFKLNYYALTSKERGQLAQEGLALAERIKLIRKCENRIKSHAENLIKEPDLRTVVTL